MAMRKRRHFLKVAIGIGLIGGLIWAFWPQYRLEVTSVDRPKAHLSFPISIGDRFSIRFLHSYDRAFFQENYQIDPSPQILLRNMTFKSHLNGAGFAYPHFHLRPDGVGELRGIDEGREKVQFMMGSKDLSDHALILNGKTFRLSEWIEPFDIVEIRLKKRMRIWDLFEKNISSP